MIEMPFKKYCKKDQEHEYSIRHKNDSYSC